MAEKATGKMRNFRPPAELNALIDEFLATHGDWNFSKLARIAIYGLLSTPGNNPDALDLEYRTRFFRPKEGQKRPSEQFAKGRKVG